MATGGEATVQVHQRIQVLPPSNFSFIPAEWTKWKRRFERFRVSSGMQQSQSQDEQVNSLIYIMGEQAEDIFQSFTLNDEQKKSFDFVMNAFESHFVVKTNVIFERARFNSRCQIEEELIEDFITSLYTLSEKCAYGTLRDEMIRDRLVVGVKDRKLSENLQLESNLNLTKAISIIRNHDNVRKQQKELFVQSQDLASTINKMKFQKPNTKNPVASYSPSYKSKRDICKRCGYEENHTESECPALKRRCQKCNKRGHFMKMCRSKNNVYSVEDYNNSENDEIDFLGMVKSSNKSEERWSAEIIINRSPVKFLLDTGAPVNVLPLQLFDKLFVREILEPSDRKLTGPSGERLDIKGVCNMNFKYGKESCEDKLYVINKVKSPLLSLKLCEGLKIIQRINFCKEVQVSTVNIGSEFPELLGKLGCLRGEYEIKLREGSKPSAIYTARRVSIPLLGKLKSKLQEMTELKVIRPVDEPTEWCSPLVIVLKPDGDIRPCVDLSKLNMCIEREIHPMPVADYTLAQLGGAKYFSKLDTKSGFWQVKLSKKSQVLTTFLTPMGRFCFQRLPFGISSAPEYFQRQIQRILEGIPGCVSQTDDILVYGRSMLEHDVNLRKVLKRLARAGVTLNKNKCQIGTTSVIFLGHLIDEKGIHPSDSKVKAVENFPRPDNISSLRQFLGLINYLGKFIPNLSTISEPLNVLLKSNSEFTWNEAQQTSFERLKAIVTSEPVLKVYDTRHRTMISSDASSYGLGAVIKQYDDRGKWRPVAYASRTLTSSEKNYAQIEKEALGIVWAVNEKFRDYVRGMEFEIETDHKPLLSIMKSKNLDDLTPRLQKFRMRLMAYKFTIQYTPGKQLIMADALSRNPVAEEVIVNDDDLDTFVNQIVDKLPASEGRLQEIREAQLKDENLMMVEQYTKQGWPCKSKINPDLKMYWDHRYSFSVNEGLLMYGSRIVIPLSMKNEIIQRLHKGHLGLGKTQSRMKQSVWWPNCKNDLENFVKRCLVCIKERIPRHEPMIPSAFPKRPWHTLGADLCYFKGKNYLVVSDYFSRYLEVEILENQSSSCVCKKLESILARHGKPNIVKTDNGPQFKSPDFRKLAKDWEFVHITSSPRFPQSNGFAESMVKVAKSLLKKNENLHQALLEYRSTPLANGFSPSELLMNRKLRSSVPIIESKLLPRKQNMNELCKTEQIRIEKAAKNFNKHHGVYLRENFEPGDVVWVRDLKRWGKIQRLADTPRSYIVTTDNMEIRRNAFHLNNAYRKDVPKDQEITNDDYYNKLNISDEIPGLSTDHHTDHADNSNLIPLEIGQPSDETSIERREDGLENNATSLKETTPLDRINKTRAGRVIKKPKQLDGFEMY